MTELDDIPVTGLSRTHLDLATVVSRRRLESGLNQADVLGLTDIVSVPLLLDRHPRRPGTAVLRDILADQARMRGVPANDFEDLFAAFVDSHGLPRPRFNADLAVAGRFFRIDALWDEARLAVELDGRQAHGTARAFESDRERDRLLQAHGWMAVRVTWKQLHRKDGALAADLRRLLARGAASTL